MPYHYSRYQREFNLAGHILFLNLSYFLVYYYVFNNLKTLVGGDYFELLLYFNVALILSAFLSQLNDPTRTTSLEILFRRLVNALGLYLLFIFALIGIKDNNYNRSFVFLSYLFTSIGIAVFHLGFILFLKYFRRIGHNIKKIIIIGYGELSGELLDFFNKNPEYGYKCLGIFDDNNINEDIQGNISQVGQFAKLNKVDEIYCCLPDIENEKVREIVNLAEDNFIKIKLIPDYRGFPYKGFEVQLYDFIPVLNVKPQPLEDGFNRYLKRFFDLIFSILIILFILSWLIPILAILIKIDSKGPVFFKQKRHGLNNKQFTCYKFRTMYMNKEADLKQAIKNDPRITNFGSFLRRTSLDEFPQFFNVLKGDMSVIGPRPHPIQLNKEFAKLIEKFMLRHSVKPGVTGLAQVKGYRGETSNIKDMKNRVKLDRFYVENWSMLFDFRIILMTVSAIFRGDEKAY